MQARVTYVYHSCFVLQLRDAVFLFDYPGDYAGRSANDILGKLIKGAELWSFSSHAHADHFSPDLFKLGGLAKKARFVLSSDIAAESTIKNVTKMTPGDRTEVDGIKVETLKSNDEGVAFIIELQGIKIYFGGDLANWNWPEESTPEEMKEAEDFFSGVVERLASMKINIAFSNADPRLKNWAGGAQLANRLRPDMFVPMHLFGDTGALKRFVHELEPENKVFVYKKPGDKITFEL
jgi:L-ascorbate metabolism protein UlaG (beta-lactamase superfamily)